MQADERKDREQQSAETAQRGGVHMAARLLLRLEPKEPREQDQPGAVNEHGDRHHERCEQQFANHGRSANGMRTFGRVARTSLIDMSLAVPSG